MKPVPCSSRSEVGRTLARGLDLLAVLGLLSGLIGTDAQASAATGHAARVAAPVASFADLGLTKEVDDPPLVPGTRESYTLTVTNSGPADAPDTVVTDPIPGDTAFVAATAGRGTCGHTAGTVRCALGTVGAGETVSVGVVLRLDASLTGKFTSIAKATSAAADPNPGNNIAKVSLTVAPEADLELGLSAKHTGPEAGDTVTYSLTVANHGPSDASDAEVSDELPAGLTVDSAFGDHGDCTVSSGLVRCALGTLANGARAMATIRASLPSGRPVGDLVDTARATATTPDPRPADNSATLTTAP